MSLSLTYTDYYLASRVTTAIETTAFSDVDALGTFPTTWRNRLTIIRAYILTCLELGGQDADTFAVKLAQYRKEWEFVLMQAKHAQATVDPTVAVPVFTIPVERA